MNRYEQELIIKDHAHDLQAEANRRRLASLAKVQEPKTAWPWWWNLRRLVTRPRPSWMSKHSLGQGTA